MSLILEHPFILTAVGKCKSGKTYLIKYLITRDRNYYDYIIIISNTASWNKDYDFLSQLNIRYKIVNTLNIPEKIKLIMDRLQGYISNNQVPKIGLIFDDCVGSIPKSGSKGYQIFEQMIVSHRHHGLSIFFNSQYITKTEPFFRELCNYAFIFKQDSQNGVRGVINNFLSGRQEEEIKSMLARLQQYQFIMVDRRENEIKIMIAPKLNFLY